MGRRVSASGRFILRVEPGLHASLRAAAKAIGVSLNEFCARKLAAPCGSGAGLDDAQRLTRHAASVLGSDLLGLVVFGSWSRGEAGPTSDFDLLLVVDSKRALTRSLYREWDRETITWGSHQVEPHFVQLPDPSSIGSVWAEAAVDGIILFERDLIVSRHLGAVRRQIVAGKLVRRVVHGQPYWAEVA